MDKYKLLSGEEIVAKGATKLEISLPEIGLKGVSPNGSWLEQKQVQSALEARKHLVEVPRIEKSGILTHAEWVDDLKLAKVTQQAGGFWQFLGHHKDRELYLRPEEALFLMEVNSLVLRYNDVIVSLQQAYSLLLTNENTIIQYKVYASLSRLGYKVFRHVSKPVSKTVEALPQTTENDKKMLKQMNDKSDIETNLSMDTDVIEDGSQKGKNNESNDHSKLSDETSMDTEESVLSENIKENESTKNCSNEAINISSDINVSNEVINISSGESATLEDMNAMPSSIELKNVSTGESNSNELSEIKNVKECLDATKSNVIKPVIIISSVEDENATLKASNANSGNSKLDNVKECTDEIKSNVIEQHAMVLEEITAEKKGDKLENVGSCNKITVNNVTSEQDVVMEVEKNTECNIKEPLNIKGCPDEYKSNVSKQEPMLIIDANSTNANEVLTNTGESSTPTSVTSCSNNILTDISTGPQVFVSDDTTMEIDNPNLRDHSDTKQSRTQEELCSETSNDIRKSQIEFPSSSKNIANIDPLTKYCQWKLSKLKERRSKVLPIPDIHKSFKDCPDILEHQIITVSTPKEEYLPKNIILNKSHYTVNIENVRTKNLVRPESTDSVYSLSDEVNGAHIRRVTNVDTFGRSNTQVPPNSAFPPFFPTFRPNVPFRHYNFWRPRPHMSYFQFNLFFQRPYMSNFHPRFQFYPRMHMPMFPRHCNPPMGFIGNNVIGDSSNNTRRRPKDRAKITHLENLKNLAQRLKNIVASGNNRPQNIEAIQSLIQTYNIRFRTRLRLSEQYEIVSDETIVDTITLEDDEDEASKAKKRRLSEQPDLFLENLNKIRQNASKLKKLESENKSSARHRRALSSVIKTFNKHFNADVHLTENFDVVDRRCINLDSSSDSDCVIEEMPKYKSGKKLRNPFNILKKLSEKQASPSSPTANRQDIPESPIVLNTYNSHEVLEKSFKKPWLPGDNDFGRPEIISRDTMTARFIETKKEDFLYDFLKDQSCRFTNWMDIKIAFLESIEETNAILHTGAMLENNIDVKSLVKPEDCTDMVTVLKKLSIINVNKNIRNESILTIDYDVYNRDIRNFRKANRPKPHFRVVCIEESSSSLAGIDIATLHDNVKDNVTVLFAIVGISSISFIQLNPTDLPVYLPCNDLG